LSTHRILLADQEGDLTRDLWGVALELPPMMPVSPQRKKYTRPTGLLEQRSTVFDRLESRIRYQAAEEEAAEPAPFRNFLFRPRRGRPAHQYEHPHRAHTCSR